MRRILALTTFVFSLVNLTLALVFLDYMQEIAPLLAGRPLAALTQFSRGYAVIIAFCLSIMALFSLIFVMKKKFTESSQATFLLIGCYVFNSCFIAHLFYACMLLFMQMQMQMQMQMPMMNMGD